jgi:hypothetical protein
LGYSTKYWQYGLKGEVMKLAYSNLKKFYLTMYRTGGFVVLISTLAALVGYGFVMTFFMFNRTWVSPTVLSQTSDRMLQFNSGYLTSLQAQATLSVLINQQKLALATTQKQFDDLTSFRSSIGSGTQLQRQKRLDLTKSAELASSLESVKTQTERSLDAGLIDKVDATREIATIQQFNNGRTDSQISLATLQQQLITLDAQINQLRDMLSVERQTISETQKNLVIAKSTVQTLELSAYADSKNGSDLAFLAYDNLDNVKEGQSVYDCSLLLVFCHKVGTIEHIYQDEQLVDFPLFNVRLSRTVRGVFIKMNLEDRTAIKSTILFAGSKPLLF